jgi:RNAse (barnase) inhibitor barstar
MSDITCMPDSGVTPNIFTIAEGDGNNLFASVVSMASTTGASRSQGGAALRREPRATPPRGSGTGLFRTVRPNIVQSIRAFRVHDLASEAQALQQHFIYAHCTDAQSRQEVLEIISAAFLFPKHFGKNYDALHDCLTDLVQKAGEQPGFVIVLEGLPVAQKFDKDGRETLLDVFRDAAEFWAERKVPFRVFYSFA